MSCIGYIFHSKMIIRWFTFSNFPRLFLHFQIATRSPLRDYSLSCPFFPLPSLFPCLPTSHWLTAYSPFYYLLPFPTESSPLLRSYLVPTFVRSHFSSLYFP